MTRGKMSPKLALLHTHKAPKEVKRLFDTIEERDKRVELNLYVSGYEDEPEEESGKDTTEGSSSESENA